MKTKLGRVEVRFGRLRALLPAGWVVPLLIGIGPVSPVSASQYSDQVMADGAIHYWRFEETSTDQRAKDEVSGVTGQTNNPGNYTGNITLGQASGGPGLGNAARLGGEIYTHVALGTPQHPGNSITVEAWVNLDVSATALFSPVLARWDGSYELDINATTGDAPNFVVRNDVNAFASGGSAGPGMTRGEWHHLAGVFDATNGTARLFLDGVAGPSETIGGVLQNAGGDDGLWYIGGSRGPIGSTWQGLLDEIAIYPRALSVSELQNHMHLASVPEPSTGTLLLLGLLGGRRTLRGVVLAR